MKTHRDFRSLDEATQAEIRRLALGDVGGGEGVKAVASHYEVHYKTVYTWRRKETVLKRRAYHGETRGRAKDEQKLISPVWEQKLQTIIKTKTPDALGIKATLWDRRALQALIQKKTKITVPLQRVSVYTKRWGFTPQRPAKYAAEQDVTKITHWLDVEYPRILARAKAEKAEIHWEDETGVALSTYHAKGYAPKGQTPQIFLPAKRARISMISSITNRGDIQFMLYPKGLNASLFIIFMKRLIAHRKRKVFLIVDNLRVHHAKAVKAWVEDHTDSIELFFPTTLRTTV